jgi:hypothetical protein
MMMIKCVLLLALLTQCVKSLKSSVELRQMMEMEVSMFLNKANRMTFEMADNVHPSELDRTEDLQSYLNKVQSSVEDNVPELDKSHALIDMIGHSMRHQVFEKIHSFVEIAESLRGVCTSRPTVPGTSASKADIKELQGMLEKKGHNPGAIDGLWGAKTKAAVKAFQTASGLSPVDGIAGKDTWNALCGASSGGSSSSGSGSSSHNNDAKPEHAATVSRSTEGGRAVIDAARGLRDFLRSAKEGYGTTFNGYGSGQYQYVCTTYVSKVLRNVGYPFSKGDDVDGMINIRGLNLPSDKDAASKKLGELVLAGEELTKGVVHALVIKKWGTEVTDLDTVQPGDLCQYWYGSKANLGHVVIVDTVLNQGHKVKVIGSHGSKKGVDFLNVNLHTMKKAYCVKPHAVDTEGSVRNEIEDDNDDPSGVAGLPTPEEEMVEDMKAHAAECKKCKANIKPDDGDPNQACSNECSVTSKDVNSENFLEDIAKNFFNGITRLHSGDTCKKFTMSWECMNAYFPHMVIIGASGNAGPVVGGAEVVTDYNAGEVGIFLYVFFFFFFTIHTHPLLLIHTPIHTYQVRRSHSGNRNVWS